MQVHITPPNASVVQMLWRRGPLNSHAANLEETKVVGGLLEMPCRRLFEAMVDLQRRQLAPKGLGEYCYLLK